MIKTLRQMVREQRQWCLDRARDFALLSVRRSIYMELAARLTTILSDTEPGEWKGPWQCEKCSKVWPKKVTAHYSGWWSSHMSSVSSSQELCDGTLVPYERRQT